MRNERRRYACIIIGLLLLMSGCANGERGREEDREPKTESAEMKKDIYEDLIRIAEPCKGIFQEENILESQREMLAVLEKEGYVAVDSENRLDMVQAQKAEDFVEQAEAGDTVNMEILRLTQQGGFTLYRLNAGGGELNVENASLWYENGEACTGYYEKFKAVTWFYTEKGYLFFEQPRMEGYDGIPGQVAIRVKPLAKECREANEKYVRQTGYERNNLLTTDWDETSYGKLEFYDLYDAFCMELYGHFEPESPDGTGRKFEVAAESFEQVLGLHLNVPQEILRANTVFLAEKGVYIYQPRGIKDFEEPYVPVPEVTAVKENPDGTITLRVEAVWYRKNTDQAWVSELTVEPQDDGKFRYVSNMIIQGDEQGQAPWYSKRVRPQE